MDSKLSTSLITILVITSFATSQATTITEQCSDSFTSVAACLNFATGTAKTPGKDCCKAVDQIKGSKPVCLCYMIQQTHNGSEQTKGAGLQEDKLLQLPSACKLANASLADCPKLLNIPSTSPDYGIFTNGTTLSSPSTGTAGSSPSTTAKDSAFAFKITPSLVSLVAITMVISVFNAAASH